MSLWFFGSWLIDKTSRRPLPLFSFLKRFFECASSCSPASSPSGLRSYSDFLFLPAANPLPISSGAFLLMANCLNMHLADYMRRTCVALATTQMRICIYLETPGVDNSRRPALNMHSSIDTEYFTPPQVARRLRVDTYTARRWIHNGH